MDFIDQKKTMIGLGGTGGGLMIGSFLIPNSMLRGALIALAVVCLLALVILAIVLWRKRKKDKEQEEAVQSLVSQSSAQESSRQLTAEEEKGLRKDLEERMEIGREVLDKANVKVSDVPWYLVMGEPKSGKTFACSALFNQIPHPEGITNAFQGKGGTLNMDWWFYEDVILLDTAGRLVFEHTPEWEALLKGLNRARPDCPINGIILVIPADSLLKDDETKVREKAGRLREQLTKTKQILDLRFPVYVWITKADLLPGYREFVVRLNATARNQIFGWSWDTKDLDDPFTPAVAEKGLNLFVDAVRQRCHATIADLAQADDFVRRVSEVDDLFVLPSSFSASGWKAETQNRDGQEWMPPNSLLLYLQEIFGRSAEGRSVSSRWKQPTDTRQLFLRGVYFNSTVFEGPVYDPDVARRFGLDPQRGRDRGLGQIQDASQGKNVFFLYDLMMKKILLEFGQVTVLENIKATRRKQTAIVMGAMALAFLVFLWFTVRGQGQFSKSVGGDKAYWQEARSHSASQQTVEDWLFKKDYKTPDDGPAGRLGFHQRLAKRVQEPLKVGFPFGTFMRWSEQGDRKRAQWTVFTNDFLVPFVAKVQKQMMQLDQAEAGGTAPSEEQVKHLLVAMVRLEADCEHKPSTPDRALSLLTNGIEFLTGSPFTNREFAEALKWTLFENEKKREAWPFQKLSQGSAYGANLPVKAATEWLVKKARQRDSSLSSRFDSLDKLERQLRDFQEAEKKLAQDIRQTDLPKVQASINAMAESASQANTVRRGLKDFAGLRAAYASLKLQVESGSSSAFTNLVKELPSTCSLSQDVTNALLNVQSTLVTDLARKGSDGTKILDEEMLDKLCDYDSRQQTYQTMAGLGEGCIAIGDRWKKWREFQTGLQTNMVTVKACSGAAAERYDIIASGIQRLVRQQVQNRLGSDYLDPAENLLTALIATTKKQSPDAETWAAEFRDAYTNCLALESDSSVDRPSLGSKAADLENLYQQVTTALTTTAAAYPENLLNRLTSQAGFPLATGQAGTGMSVEAMSSVQRLCSGLKATPEKLGLLPGDSRFSKVSEKLKILILGKLDKALGQLFPNGEALRCKVTVLTGEPADASNANELRFGRIEQAGKGGDAKSIDKTENFLGEVLVDQPFKLALMPDSQHSPYFTSGFHEWELVREVVANPGGEAEPIVLKKQVQVHDRKYTLRLRLDFLPSNSQIKSFKPPF